MVEVEDPFARSVVGLAEIVVVAGLTGPGVNATVGEVVVIGAPPMVPEMVAVPIVVGDVRMAVYVPSA
jgi:hypothetical protein